MSNYWNELNNFEDTSSSYGLIPNGTIAKVKMTIKKGKYNDLARGWTDDYASKSIVSGNIYLDVEYTVLEGAYAKRKVWGLIGLESQNGPGWNNIGKAFIKGIINSAYGLSQKDTSDSAIEKRKLESFAPLDGVEFVARIDITKDPKVGSKNEIRAAITPDHKDYAAVMGNFATTANSQQQSTYNNNRPAWA